MCELYGFDRYRRSNGREFGSDPFGWQRPAELEAHRRDSIREIPHNDSAVAVIDDAADEIVVPIPEHAIDDAALQHKVLVTAATGKPLESVVHAAFGVVEELGLDSETAAIGEAADREIVDSNLKAERKEGIDSATC